MKQLSLFRLLEENLREKRALSPAQFMEKYPNLTVGELSAILSPTNVASDKSSLVVSPSVASKIGDLEEFAEDLEISFSDQINKIFGSTRNFQGLFQADDPDLSSTAQQDIARFQTPEYKKTMQQTKAANLARHGPGSEAADPFAEFEQPLSPEEEKEEARQQQLRWQQQQSPMSLQRAVTPTAQDRTRPGKKVRRK